ncbi:AMP-binding protein [Nocardioides sp. YIM 152315]|uniref:AMP-binding protein n=1 Tax=Nocardioides sp. YIM 152315 TaxID=3031760 RepID=UPI0023D9F501|nr:AMP-binding protein [Nocardioides sp. YIM 152315]MDF1602479.1 AMP-binding protein [Nocardioides sp. YIM 152315]
MGERTLVSLLVWAEERWPERSAWTFVAADRSERTLTFADVGARTAALAQALRERGVAAGDRVAVMLDNEPEFPLVWLALARLGAAIVPLNVRYRTVDAQHLLDDADVRLAVTSSAYAERLRALAPAPAVVLVDALEPDGEFEQGPVDAATIVNVQYTSGTTGRPKGCLLSHRYWTTLAASLVEEFPRITSDDVMLTAQPFFYLDPMWNVVTALMSGAHLVVLDGFHPSSFWEAVRRHEVTYFYCLAAMPTLLLKIPPDPADRDHRVRAVQCSAIPTALHSDLEERWGVPWFEAFGMTETGADLRVSPADHDELVGTGCLGRPAAHREVRIDDDGQMWLRGPGMMDGYLGHPDPFVGGWFPTGDLARLDDRGRVYLTGRLKDMIRRSGENVAAREVEEVLLAHPAVRLAAVVGVPDEIRGEEVKAYVVAPGASSEALTAWCEERLAGFKVPRLWEFRDDLPLTPSHRVEKSKL